MRHTIFMLLLLSLFIGTANGAIVSGSTENRLKQLGERSAKVAAGKAAEYAKDLLETAKLSVQAAQAAALVGNEVMAIQKIELADLQLTVAETKASTKETVELVAVKRAELKKLDARLENLRLGGE